MLYNIGCVTQVSEPWLMGLLLIYLNNFQEELPIPSVLALLLASTNVVQFCIKDFKTTLLPNLIMDYIFWYDNRQGCRKCHG